MLVKDEADVIATTLRHLRTQVDFAIVLDNGSTDGTRQIIEEVQNETSAYWLDVRDDPEVGYYQSAKMTALARDAAEMGHEWVLPCDADEIWYSDHGRVGDLLGLFTHVDVAEALLYDHVATSHDPEESDPIRRLGWHRWDPGRLPKVACRVRPGLVIEMGNHGAHYPGPVTTMQRALVVRHFPYRSIDQMIKKVRNGAAAYAATTLPPGFGQHWRDYGELLNSGGVEAIADVFRTWFWSPNPEIDQTLIYDPAPIL